MKRIALAVLLLSTVACGSNNNSPTSPGPTNPTTPAPASLITLNGTVSSQAGAKIANASVVIVDGVNAGRGTTTDGAGNFIITSVTPSGGTLQASGNGFEPKNAGFSNVSTAFAFVLRTAVPFSQSGRGDTVFDMPTFITRIQVHGSCSCYSTNFVVEIDGRLVVNELLGDGWGTRTYDGTLLTKGGTVAITDSSAVSWTFTEVR